jgi:hypothetical protein
MPFIAALLCTSVFAQPQVRVLRVADHGVQPEVAIDSKSIVHLIYLTGNPQASDIIYATAPADTISFGRPIRVNTHPGSAIATGTIRGPHLSIDPDGRPHIAWMGSSKAQPKASGKQAPMLYTRLGGDGHFEPERNLATKFTGLDGGGTVAAGPFGNIYVAWHAPGVAKGDESTRRVFVARSRDGGKTFDPEQPVDVEGLGACACCGMALLAPPGGAVVGLFRTATDQIHRDTRAFLFQETFTRHWGGVLDPAESGTCVMSTYALADIAAHHRFVAAWETLGSIRFGVYSYRSTKSDHSHDVPGANKNAKHPAIAINKNGDILIAWAKDTGWEKGGSVAWQVFDARLNPIVDAAGHAEDLPVWSKPAACSTPDGNFVVLY